MQTPFHNQSISHDSAATGSREMASSVKPALSGTDRSHSRHALSKRPGDGCARAAATSAFPSRQRKWFDDFTANGLAAQSQRGCAQMSL